MAREDVDTAKMHCTSPFTLDPVMGKLSNGIHNWTFRVLCVKVVGKMHEMGTDFHINVILHRR